VSSSDSLPEMSTRHCRRTPARAQREEDTGAERPFLSIKSRSPGVRMRRFLSFASRIFTNLVGLLGHPGPLKPSRGGPVVLPDGRATRRLTFVRVRRSSPRAGLGLPPFAKASRDSGSGTPRAAGAAPHPHFQNHFRKRPRVGGNAVRIRGAAGAGISFCLVFLSSCQPALERTRGAAIGGRFR
jgi:hypothetical protein